MHLKPVSYRVLTGGYTMALLVIAGLSIASHLVLDYGLQSSEGSAAIVNQTGRQRMLSQRIAGLAAQYRLGDLSARADLTTAISEFETSHEALILSIRTSTLNNSAAEQLQALYFTDTNPLDAQVRSFVADARRVAASSAPNDPALAVVLPRIFAEARSPLLAGLNRVVSIHQQESERRIQRLVMLQWSILAVVLITLVVEAMVVFRPMIRRVVAYTSELLRLATTDLLTNAANRRSFMERCDAEVRRARRYGRPGSLLMLDVDHFKSINDTYGHAAGDDVLRVLGEMFPQSLRQIDIWGRLGGEEFAVLLVETGLPEAARVAERMRQRVAAMTVQHGDFAINFTVSIGVTALSTGDGGLESGLQLADKLMYQAKQTGRNRVVAEAMA